MSDPKLKSRMNGRAVYAGSFDPPTNGHVWMIDQGAHLFDELIIAVAKHPEKEYTFEIDERLGWLEQIAARHTNVKVASIQNEFLARYAKRVDANFVIRGIRHEADYQYERGMRYVNSDLNPDLTSIFLMPPRTLCELSSSFVKGMIGPEGWESVVERYVPESVFERLKLFREEQL